MYTGKKLRTRVLLSAVLLGPWVGLHAADAANTTRPNIVLIFADDWGWGDLSCHGHPWLKTPNLDRLASEGIDFQQFNVLNPVCSPSRAAVMTGLYPARFSIHQHFANPRQNAARGMPDWLDPDAVMLPRLLKQAGYRTAHFGKWHLTNRETHGAPEPTAYGYDEFKVFNGGAEWPSADLLAAGDDAAAFIKATAGKPFFMNVWLHEAHTPHVPTKESMEKWKNLDEQKQVYAAVITDGDNAVGKILAALKEVGVDQNTIVMFSSDNGPERTGKNKSFGGVQDAHTSSQGYDTYYSVGDTGGLRGRKRSLFEGGVRVPFIVRWPGHTPTGMKNDRTVVTAVDLLPTLCAAAGLKCPDGYQSDGENLLAAFKGENHLRTRPIFWEWRGTHTEPDGWPRLAVREGDWKLTLMDDGSRAELFHLAKDRAEATNVAKDHPDTVAHLKKRALDWKAALPAKPDPDCISTQHAPSSPTAARTEWWREAKFGMFIHWGLYAEPARGEWVMNKERIPIAEYKKLAAGFNPVKFNAAEWVAVAKAAGMRYMTITSKHHDGFALFDSDASDFNIVDATPFKRDVIRELSEACAKEGIRFGVYYSQAQDWSHPGGSMASHAYWDPAQIKGTEAFETYLHTISIPQLKEVISIAKPSHIWFDTPIGMDARYGREIVQAIRSIKPDTLLNSRLLYHGYQVETLTPDQLAELKDVGVDFLSYRDRSIPAETFAGWDWETCMTLNGAWGFSMRDQSWKSPVDVVRMLSHVASKGGNFLLNFGPTAAGEIPPAGVAVVKQVGDWLRVNGEAIYGTRGCDLKKVGALKSGPDVHTDGSLKANGRKKQAHGAVEFDWLATARSAEPGVPEKIYLHVFTWPAGPLEVKGIAGTVRKAYLLGDRSAPLLFSQTDGVFSVTLPQHPPDPIASVVCLEWVSGK